MKSITTHQTEDTMSKIERIITFLEEKKCRYDIYHEFNYFKLSDWSCH